MMVPTPGRVIYALTVGLAAVAEVPTEVVQRSVWDVIQEIATFLVALGTLYVIVIRPAVRKFEKRRNRERAAEQANRRREIEEIVHAVTRVEKQVTPNGSSTPAERQVSTADRLVKIERVASANTNEIKKILNHGQEHEDKGRKYVAKVIEALRAQGIEVPDPDETEES